MIAVCYQRGTANVLANLEAQLRYGFVPQKAYQGSDCHRTEIRDGLGVEETRQRLIACDDSAAQDQSDNEDARQVFRTTQTIGEAWRRWTSREHKGYPERQRRRGITNVVDGIRQERDTAGQPDNHPLEERRGP